MAEQHYRIGDVAKQLGLRTSVLRFWETEFKALKPLRTESGQRLYREKDLELAKQLQHLLHHEGLTLEGARRVLAGESALHSSGEAQQAPLPEVVRCPHKAAELLQCLENELLSVQALLRAHREPVR